jgi:hypothetical protein
VLKENYVVIEAGKDPLLWKTIGIGKNISIIITCMKLYYFPPNISTPVFRGMVHAEQENTERQDGRLNPRGNSDMQALSKDDAAALTLLAGCSLPVFEPPLQGTSFLCWHILRVGVARFTLCFQR